MSNEIDSSCDVIVIGAGPAGSVAAADCASAGLKTLLLEKRPVVGIPVRCGEASTSVARIAEYAPVRDEWIETELNGVVFHGTGGHVVRYDKKDLGTVLDRTKFDAGLAEHAVSRGAVLALRAQAKDVGPAENGARRVLVATPEGEAEVRARVVIGADGVEALSGEWAGLRTRQLAPHTCSAIEFKLDMLIPESDRLVLWQGRDTVNDGYIWAFPKAKSKTTNFGAGILVPKAGAPNIAELTEEWLEKFYPGARVLSRCGGAAPVSGTLEQTVGDRFLLAGDSAHHTNPLTGGGIAAALAAGRLAARTIAEGFHKGDLSETFLRRYHDACWQAFGRTHERYFRMRRALLAMDARDQSRFYAVMKAAVERGKAAAFAADPAMALRMASLAFSAFWKTRD